MTSSSILTNTNSENVGKKFYVRFKLSLRCDNIVRKELKKLETNHTLLPYNAIEFPDGIEQKKVNTFNKNLQKSGMDLLNLYESLLIDKIISTIIEVIHNFDQLPSISYKDLIAENLDVASESVLKIFSEVVGMSVIQFIVIQKVDRVKEHLLYNDYSLGKISKKLNYESENHLIAQFKKITGLTPDHFQKLKEERKKLISQNKNESKEKKTAKSKPAG